MDDSKTVIDLAGLGWLCDMRQSRIPDLGDRFAAAVAQRAAGLGIVLDGGVSPGDFFAMPMGTVAECVAADKLLAYIDGLADALTDTYGNPPVEVGRKDLRAVLDAVRSGWLMVNPDLAAAQERLRSALDGTVSDGQPVGP